MKIAKNKREQYEGLNNPLFNAMLFPMQGKNIFRGLDNGQPVEITDSKGKKRVLRGNQDTDVFEGQVSERRVGGWLDKYQNGGSTGVNTGVVPLTPQQIAFAPLPNNFKIDFKKQMEDAKQKWQDYEGSVNPELSGRNVEGVMALRQLQKAVAIVDPTPVSDLAESGLQFAKGNNVGGMTQLAWAGVPLLGKAKLIAKGLPLTARQFSNVNKASNLGNAAKIVGRGEDVVDYFHKYGGTVKNNWLEKYNA